MKRLAIVALVAFSALLLVAGQAKAAVVFSQNANQWGAYTSQYNTSGSPSTYFAPGDTATVYDNFTLGSSASIARVTWIGTYYDGPPQPLSNGSNLPPNIEGQIPPAGAYGYGPAAAGTITGFTIKFWSNTGSNTPDLAAGPIQTVTVSGNAGQTDLGITDTEVVYYGPNEMYGYGTALATPFAATGGTQYWLSIVADSAFAPEWGWDTAGVRYVGDAYRQDAGDPTLRKNVSGGDFAFALETVPEPVSMVFFGTGLVGICGYVARRRIARKVYSAK